MDFSETNSSDEAMLQTLTSAFQSLHECLRDERNALVAHDREQLQLCIARKNELCQQIGSTLHSTPGQQLSRLLSEGDPTKLEPHHRTLFELATSARDSNLVNGKILHRSQQSLREILKILSGKDLDGLYGQSGQQDSATNSGGSAIAQA